MVVEVEVWSGVLGSQPPCSSQSLFLLSDQLPLISHEKSFVRTGTARNETSIPLFSMRPALIFIDVAPISALCEALIIWSVVVVL